MSKNTRENLQKFRVWDFKLDKFHYFSLQDLMRNWINGSKSHFKYDDIDLDNIQEFTGILDSNRREVWEGDIVEQSHPVIWGSNLYFWKDKCYNYRGVVRKPSKISTIISIGDLNYGKYAKSEFILVSLNSEEGKLEGCNIMAENKVLGNIYENIDLCEYDEVVRQYFVDENITHYYWGNLHNNKIQKYIKDND